MKAKILSLLLVVALVLTVSIFAGQAAEPEFDSTTTVCSHCGTAPAGGWVQYANQQTTGHYYVSEDMTLSGQLTVGDGDKICLYIDNCTMSAKATTRGYLIRGTGAELNIMGTGIFTGAVNHTSGSGGLIYMHADGGVLNIYDTVTVRTAASGCTQQSSGGVISANSAANEINMYGGTITAGNPASGVTGTSGGAVYLTGGAKLTMTAGTINGASSAWGGAVHVAGGSSLTMSGTAEISGGSASRMGGSVYVTGSASTFNMNGGSVTGGKQTSAPSTTNLYGGGAVYVTNGATMTMTTGTVQGAQAKENGGSVYLNNGTLNMTGGTIKSASAADGIRGGVIYMVGANSVCSIGKTGATEKTAKIEGAGMAFSNGGLICNAAGTVDIYDGAWITGGISAAGENVSMGGGALYVTGTTNIHGGLIDGNTCYTYGGNILVTSGGKLNISGGTISGGKAEKGGNIFNSGTLTVSGGTISGGSATDDTIAADTSSLVDNFGGNIYNNAKTVTISNGEITGGTAENGGNIYSVAAVNMTGGTITDGTATTGGNIYAMAELAVSGGTITEGTAENGGNIYATAAINMTGGTISYGESTKTIADTSTGYASYGGGNVFLTGTAATFKMDGDNALVTEGDAAFNGGNIFLLNGAKFWLVTGTVSNGEARFTGNTAGDCGLQGGGNINANGGSTIVDIDGGTITGGTAKRGGNIALTHDAGMDVSGNAEISVTTPMANTSWLGANIFVRGTSSAAGDVILGGNCTISGAETYSDTDSDYGGNIYLHNYSNLTLKENAVITGGKAKNGGNIYMSSATSKAMIQGGEISSGRAKGSSGTNICMNIGTLQLSGGEICDGMNSGSSVYVNNNTNNKVTLSDTAQVDQLLIRGTGTAQADIQVEDSFTGKAQLRFADTTDEEKEFYNSIGYGTVLTGSTNVTVAETYANTGSILVGAGAVGGTYLNAVYGDYGTDGAKALVVANYKKTDASRKSSYIVNLSEVGAGECLTLIRNMELTLSQDMIVDTNGNNATVTTTNGAKVSLIDLTNTETSTKFGKVTVDGSALASYLVNFGGSRYVTVQDENGAYSAHKILVQMDTITLRTPTAGIYYNVNILCDGALAALVQSYGVALSVKSMPDDTFANLGTARTDVLYSATARCGCSGVCQHPDAHFESFTSGSYTSCALNNILTANLPEGGATNSQRGQMPVYANGYVSILMPDGSGLILMTDETNWGKTVNDEGFTGIAYSIYDVMKMLDDSYDELDANVQNTVVSFYTTWQAEISDWELPKIKQAYQNSLA